MKRFEKKDSGYPGLKAYMREKYIGMIDNPNVLDLYCGKGEMYERVYTGIPYQGLDNKKTHEGNCVLTDNHKWVKVQKYLEYNFFDFDAYGEPWKLMFEVAPKIKAERFVVVGTDGMYLHLRASDTFSNIAADVEGMPRGFKVPAPARWYREILVDIILKFADLAGAEILAFELATNKPPNPIITTHYWVMLLEKIT